jgi:hypothetical protein
MKFPMTGQEKGDPLTEVAASAGLTVQMFDILLTYKLI